MTRPETRCWLFIERTDDTCKRRGDWQVTGIGADFCRQHALRVAEHEGMNHIWHRYTGQRVELPMPDTAQATPDDGLTDHCGCCAHRRSTGCGGKDCPCAQATPESSKQARARTVACSWCGRSIYEADGRWLATKGKERGYDPLLCDANDDGAHEPAVEGSSTADGGDEGV